MFTEDPGDGMRVKNAPSRRSAETQEMIGFRHELLIVVTMFAHNCFLNV